MADFNTLFIEQNLPINAAVPANQSGTAITGAWASFQYYTSAVVIIQCGAMAGGTPAVTLSQAKDTAGTSSKSLAYTVDGFNPTLGTTATQANLWSNTSSAGALITAAISSNTFNIGTANTLYCFEVFARSLDVNNGFTCFRANIASPGSNVDLYGILYIMRLPAYEQSYTSLPTPLSA